MYIPPSNRRLQCLQRKVHIVCVCVPGTVSRLSDPRETPTDPYNHGQHGDNDGAVTKPHYLPGYVTILAGVCEVRPVTAQLG